MRGPRQMRCGIASKKRSRSCWQSYCSTAISRATTESTKLMVRLSITCSCTHSVRHLFTHPQCLVMHLPYLGILKVSDGLLPACSLKLPIFRPLNSTNLPCAGMHAYATFPVKTAQTSHSRPDKPFDGKKDQHERKIHTAPTPSLLADSTMKQLSLP